MTLDDFRFLVWKYMMKYKINKKKAMKKVDENYHPELCEIPFKSEHKTYLKNS
jgi:hypothetical protein